MKKYIRVIIIIVSVFGIVLLARNKVAWASGISHEANQTDLVQLTSFVWDDLDRDGVQEEGEIGIPNITVNLYASTLELVNTTITDETGLYQFTDLTPGDYFVEFVKPAGYTFSPQHRGDNDALDSEVDITTGRTDVKTLVAGENDRIWDAGLYQLDSFIGKPEPGTVKPPPRVVKTCKDGNYSVGGVSGLKVSGLKPGYCLKAFLWNHRFAFGRIPKDAGKLLADITFLQIFHYGRLIQELPVQDGKIMICYAVPPNKQAQIYFYDFNRAHFGKKTGQPSWEPLPTTVENGVACAPAQSTGAYALIGK